MDKPISVGDLVIIASCLNPEGMKFIGEIRTVARPCTVYPSNFDLEPPTFININGKPIELSWHPRRIKRIPPPEELGLVNEKESEHA